MRHSILLSAALSLAVASPIEPVHPPNVTDFSVIEGKYIVVLKQGSQVSDVHNTISKIASDADHVYNNLGGFAASLTEEEVEIMRNDPAVSYVEQDVTAQVAAVQQFPEWNLARLSNKGPGGNSYTYPDNAGEGVCVYVVDSGIDLGHADFEGRATFVATIYGETDNDDYGHGTHVSGTIAGKTYGVAKLAKLFSVKIFNKYGFGSAGYMVAGMEKVLEDAPNRDCPNGVVVNLSFVTVKMQAVNDAAKALTDAGYFVSAAAGNGGANGQPFDTAIYSPSSEPSVCTVGATGHDDIVAWFCNYGAGIDIFAPGVDVKSDIPGGETGVASGTSMGAAHVSGLGASFLSQGMNGTGICEHLQSIAVEGAVFGLREGTANLLTQNGLAPGDCSA